MALYSRPETSFWYYEFKVEGKRFRGSTKTADRVQAEAFEALQRLKALQSAKDSRAALEGAVSRTTLWEAAQSWLATTTLGDHKGNLSRVRKLFGTEMHLVDGLWREVASSRFALSKTTALAEVSPGVLEELKETRRREGNSTATVERELSLLRVLLVHAQTMAEGGAVLPKVPANVRRQTDVQRRFTRPPLSTKETQDRPTFSYDERRKLGALVIRLSAHLRTKITLEFGQGERLGETCTLRVGLGPRKGLALAAIPQSERSPDEFLAEVRRAQVEAIQIWKGVK